LERLTRKPVVPSEREARKTRERAARSSERRAGSMEEAGDEKDGRWKRRVHDPGDPEGVPGGHAIPRRRGFVVLLLSLLVTGLFNVWLSGQCIRTGYRVSAALEEKRTLQKEQEVLRLEALALRSPPASTPSRGTTSTWCPRRWSG